MTKFTNIIEYWIYIKKLKPNDNLTFIHTPKCGGSYIGNILKHLNIRNKVKFDNNGVVSHHLQASKNDGITFTVIRDPVKRFESLINYRLGEIQPRPDWPKQLKNVYRDKSIDLNTIVSKMTDENITNFRPYSTLIFWSKNVDIFITIDQLYEFLSFFGYSYNIKDFEKKNVSKKTRGTFNDFTKSRLRLLYIDDIVFFNKVIKQL